MNNSISRFKRGWPWFALLLLNFVFNAQALEVQDDLGQKFKLAEPAKRIIALTPNATELLFAVGAGEQMVAAVEYADFPEAAKKLPQVGNYAAIAFENVMALEPDLIIYWPEGNPKRDIARMQSLGLPLFASNPNSFADIAKTVRQFGKLTGHEAQATSLAEQFEQEVLFYRAQNKTKARISVFYQVWNSPMLSQNGESFISKVIELCGGKNIFANLPMVSPQVSVEAVLAANPDIILAGAQAGKAPEWLQDWQQYPELKAVKNQQLRSIESDLIHRPSLRLLEAAKQMCSIFDQVRAAHE